MPINQPSKHFYISIFATCPQYLL